MIIPYKKPFKCDGIEEGHSQWQIQRGGSDAVAPLIGLVCIAGVSGEFGDFFKVEKNSCPPSLCSEVCPLPPPLFLHPPHALAAFPAVPRGQEMFLPTPTATAMAATAAVASHACSWGHRQCGGTHLLTTAAAVPSKAQHLHS